MIRIRYGVAGLILEYQAQLDHILIEGGPILLHRWVLRFLLRLFQFLPPLFLYEAIARDFALRLVLRRVIPLSRPLF